MHECITPFACDAASGGTPEELVRRIDPTTEEPLEEIADHDPAEIERRLRLASGAFQSFGKSKIEDRGVLMHRAAKLLRERSALLSALMTREMGKPITGAEAEIEKCAACCDHFAERAAEYLSPHSIPSDAAKSYVRYYPLGPVLAIMPWNFPFWQVIRFAAPALMAGNVGVLKHAPNVPECALALESIFVDAGFPLGAFVALLISDNTVVENVIRHPAIRAVTLTGSGRAGQAVASIAGSVLKKTVLELGGSDPFIVLKDADIDAVAKQAAGARCINSGQSCIAAKRFIVEAPIYDRFEQAFARELTALKVGDPFDRATQVGPLARLDLLGNLDRQVQETVAAGARLVTGGKRLARPGYFYAPTLLSGVRPGMASFDEETFGPVAALLPAKDPQDAVRLANLSHYGLGASLWTHDLRLAERLVEQIECGCVFINGIVKSDPRLPFGGVKESGYGRELGAVGIHEFVNLKTVWIA